MISISRVAKTSAGRRFPPAGRRFPPAGRPDFKQDDDFHLQGCNNFSRTAISSGRTTKYLTGRRKTQQGEW